MTPTTLLAVGLAILLGGCSPAQQSPPPSATDPRDDSMADVSTFKGGMTRSGTNPGPGPGLQPVVLWSVDVPAPVPPAPLVVDGQVIAIGSDGGVRALDAASGAQLWTVELPAGVTMTPTVADDTLYVITDDGALRTVTLADRQVGWSVDGFLPVSTISVTDELVIAGAPGELVALDRRDGSTRWRVAAPGSDRTAVDGDMVVVSGAGSGRISGLSLADGAVRWSFETSAAQVLTPGIVEGVTYVAARDTAGGRNIVYALSAGGEERWHSTGPDIIAATSVVGDRVFVATDEPDTAVKALDRATGDLLWQRSLGGSLISILLVADGLIYVTGDEEALVAIDTESGDVQWRGDIGPASQAGLAVTGGLAVVTTRDGDGRGRVLALVDPGDPRVAARPRPSTAPTARPTEAPAPLSILSVDDIAGQTLLLSTAVAPDGTMYVGDMRNSRIVVRGPDGTIESWGEYGSGPGQFNFQEVTRNDTSVGVSVSPDGELIAVGDGGNHRVQLFNGNREFLLSIGRLGREDGQFVNPCCVTVDAEHRIWVVDTGRADVQVFSTSGEHLLTFAEPGYREGQLTRPASAFVDVAQDAVYIADFGNRRVAVFKTDGTWVRSYAGRMGPNWRLDETNHVALDTFGRLLIVDTTNRIFVVEPSGELAGSIGPIWPDVGPVEMASFAVDSQGRLYIADIGGETAGRLVIAQLEAPLWPAR